MNIEHRKNHPAVGFCRGPVMLSRVFLTQLFLIRVFLIRVLLIQVLLIPTLPTLAPLTGLAPVRTANGQAAGGMLSDKRYVIKQYRRIQVLCDPYVVRKDDWVLKIFRQRGEIVEKSYAEFMDIFKEINPAITNIDRILPGQRIFIPLKKIEPDTFPDQSGGIVVLPLVTISTPAEEEAPSTPDQPGPVKPYVVKEGDSLSRIYMRRTGAFDLKRFRRFLEAFRNHNPGVVDLDLIFPEQVLHLPPAMGYGPSPVRTAGLPAGGEDVRPQVVEIGAAALKRPQPGRLPLAAAASLLNARLLDRGIYHFPDEVRKGLKLDLSLFPVMIINRKHRLVFTRDYPLNNVDLRLLRAHWPEVRAVTVGAEATLSHVLEAAFAALGKNAAATAFTFAERGLTVKVRSQWALQTLVPGTEIPKRICITPLKTQQKRTPPEMVAYLKKHDIHLHEIVGDATAPLSVPAEAPPEADVPVGIINPAHPDTVLSALIPHLGYRYDRDVDLAYPYVGVTVETVSNLISDDKGTLVFVDYGDFGGDALEAIRKAGFDIFQVAPQASVDTMLSMIAEHLNISLIRDPVFQAAERAGPHNISVTVPGYLLRRGNLKVAASRIRMPAGVRALLERRGIGIVYIREEP